MVTFINGEKLVLHTGTGKADSYQIKISKNSYKYGVIVVVVGYDHVFGYTLLSGEHKPTNDTLFQLVRYI